MQCLLNAQVLNRAGDDGVQTPKVLRLDMRASNAVQNPLLHQTQGKSCCCSMLAALQRSTIT